MKNQWIQHGILTGIILGILLIVGYILEIKGRPQEFQKIEKYENILSIEGFQPTVQLHRQILSAIIEDAKGDSIEADMVSKEWLSAFDEYRENYIRYQLNKQLMTARKLSVSGWEFVGMWFYFFFGFIVVFCFAFYLGIRISVYRFFRLKQRRVRWLERFQNHSWNWKTNYVKDGHYLLKWLGLGWLKSIGFLIVFSPAYVVAYSFRSSIDVDHLVYFILLGIFTNGVLATVQQRFYSLLVTESKKGYVETARVKNLSEEWVLSQTSFVSWKQLFHPMPTFKGHVFQHMYNNAWLQFTGTIRQQSAMIISGLMIIEMALNIQGRISYELMQSFLFGQYFLAFCFMASLFIIVSFMESIAIYYRHILNKKYQLS